MKRDEKERPPPRERPPREPREKKEDKDKPKARSPVAPPPRSEVADHAGKVFIRV